MRDSEVLASSEHKKRKGDRVGVRFGHPVLYKPLMTPMVAAKSQHLLKNIYNGRTSMDGTNTAAAGYSDVYMDSMDANKAGKTTESAPYEIVNESEMDFQHYMNRPEFRDEAGGEGELYGHAQDLIRPGTPGTMTTMLTRTGTKETYDGRSRSQSREAFGSRARGGSEDSERSRTAEGGETEYPRGYHQTPTALREHSPAGSDFSFDAGGSKSGRLGFQGAGKAPTHKDSDEGLVASAARMGRSPLPAPDVSNTFAPTPGGYGPVGTTPGSTPGEEEMSYDYFRRGRNT